MARRGVASRRAATRRRRRAAVGVDQDAAGRGRATPQADARRAAFVDATWRRRGRPARRRSTAEGVVAGDGKTGQITLDAVRRLGSIEERIVDGIVYMQLRRPAVRVASSAASSGCRSSLDELQQRGGDARRSGRPGAVERPARRASSTSQGLSGDVEKVGDDTVAGRARTHYRATIDYAKVARQAARRRPRASATSCRSSGTVPVDVWIDDDDRVVKMHLAIDAGSLGAAAGTVEMTMEITDFGVPVDVQAPPADQTDRICPRCDRRRAT